MKRDSGEYKKAVEQIQIILGEGYTMEFILGMLSDINIFDSLVPLMDLGCEKSLILEDLRERYYSWSSSNYREVAVPVLVDGIGMLTSVGIPMKEILGMMSKKFIQANFLKIISQYNISVMELLSYSDNKFGADILDRRKSLPRLLDLCRTQEEIQVIYDNISIKNRIIHYKLFASCGIDLSMCIAKDWYRLDDELLLTSRDLDEAITISEEDVRFRFGVSFIIEHIEGIVGLGIPFDISILVQEDPVTLVENLDRFMALGIKINAKKLLKGLKKRSYLAFKSKYIRDLYSIDQTLAVDDLLSITTGYCAYRMAEFFVKNGVSKNYLASKIADHTKIMDVKESLYSLLESEAEYSAILEKFNFVEICMNLDFFLEKGFTKEELISRIISASKTFSRQKGGGEWVYAVAVILDGDIEKQKIVIESVGEACIDIGLKRALDAGIPLEMLIGAASRKGIVDNIFDVIQHLDGNVPVFNKVIDKIFDLDIIMGERDYTLSISDRRISLGQLAEIVQKPTIEGCYEDIINLGKIPVNVVVSKLTPAEIGKNLKTLLEKYHADPEEIKKTLGNSITEEDKELLREYKKAKAKQAT